MIDGEGSPEGMAFQDAIGALYSTAYTTKFQLKKDGRDDFVVPPLEALWWADDESTFEENRRDEWQWTLMVILPDHVAEEDTTDRIFGRSPILENRGFYCARDRLRKLWSASAGDLGGLRLGPWKWRELGIECVLQWFWQEDTTAATECQLRATAFNAVAQAQISACTSARSPMRRTSKPWRV